MVQVRYSTLSGITYLTRSAASYDVDLRFGGVPVLQYLAHGDVDLKFDIPFEWNIDELTTFVAGWLVNDHDAPRASMVGIMSSASLLSVISNLVGPELAQVFKALIYTSSLIFNSTDEQHTYSDQSMDIKILRHCGHMLLQHLDAHIRPTALARLNKHELYAIFLLVLGCIISSKYVAESLGDLSCLQSLPNLPAISQQLQPSIAAHSGTERGAELVKLLSYQLVYIGQSTGLLRGGLEVDLINDLTMMQWRKRAQFTWQAPVGLQSSSPVQAAASTKSTSRGSHAYMGGIRPVWPCVFHHRRPSMGMAEPLTLDMTFTGTKLYNPEVLPTSPCDLFRANQPVSPMDFSMADFDPYLPTLGMDTSVYDSSTPDDWAFLSRVPTPPPSLEESEVYAITEGIDQQYPHTVCSNTTASLNLGVSLPELLFPEPNKAIENMLCDDLWLDTLEDMAQGETQQDFSVNTHVPSRSYDASKQRAEVLQDGWTCGQSSLCDDTRLTRPRLFV